MKVALPYLVQDKVTISRKGLPPIERIELDGVEDFLDGPVSRNVAIVDFDEQTGGLMPPVPFRPPDGDRKVGFYDAPDDPDNRAFQAVSVFATVHKTLRNYEVPDVLGRAVTWAFDGPQLLVVPRAGQWANAFYERESRSLQFFSFQRGSQTVHTSQSLDVVAHETGHAIVDGIAPDLYDAITPQALALHEAVADLTALTVALDSGTLRAGVLKQTNGRIDGWTALSALAEEFGSALGQGKVYLRSLFNDKTLDRNDRSIDRDGEPNLVDPYEPHDACQVITGALFGLLVEIHNRRRKAGGDDLAASGAALGVAALMLRRFAFRALDYLPPGDVSFADYGRAIVAADQASNPKSPRLRDALTRELVRRAVVARARDLEVAVPRRAPFDPEALDVLADTEWAAYDFANRERKLLRIPDGVPFRVLPRRRTSKVTYLGPRRTAALEELIFKVAWEQAEPNDVGSRWPDQRLVTMGTTLVFDRRTGKLHTRLTTDPSRAQRQARSHFLRRALDEELLRDSSGSHASAMMSVDTSGDRLRIRGGARALHLALSGGPSSQPARPSRRSKPTGREVAR